MTTTPITPELTLQRAPDSQSIKIVADKTFTGGFSFLRMQVPEIDGVRLMPNASEDPSVITVVGPPDGVHELVFDTQLSDRVIKAVLNFHLPGCNAKIVDEINNRTFFARVPWSLRGTGDLITAPTFEQLQQKFDPPRAHGHPHDKYNLGRDFPYLAPLEHGSPMFVQGNPYRDGSLFGDQGEPDLIDYLLGSMPMDGSYPNSRARQSRQEREEAAEAALLQHVRNMLMKAFAGTDVTTKIEADGTCRFVGEIVFNPNVHSQADTPTSPETDAQADSQD